MKLSRLVPKKVLKRAKKTKLNTVAKKYRYYRYILKDIKKDEYASLKCKKMHYNLAKDNMLTTETKKILLTKIFKKQVGYELNLNNPKTMSEKIMWLKLYYHNPLVTKCADKFALKDYVANVIGEEYVVPVIESWINPDHIDFSTLPDQYVMKVNWSSGYLKIVKDKSEVDEEKLRKQLKAWMRPYRNAYYQSFNWGFKNMPAVVFAEKYMEQPEGELYDYKFFCFNGKVEIMFIATDRFNKDKTTSHDFFDKDFNPLDITFGGRAHVPDKITKPINFDKMKELAEKLAKPFPFVRVDFYEVDGKIYVGEMTFYPGGALLKYEPAEWETKLGDMLQLPPKTVEDPATYYNPLTPRECFMMEDKITLKEQKQHCIQKAYKQMGYCPNIDNPQSFNEKIIWLALYYKNPNIKIAADKHLAKKYISDIVGEKYVVPLIGVYEDVNDIDFDKLPKQFVCKASDGWGANEVKIIKDKNVISKDYLKAQMSNWLYPWSNYYYQNMCITDQKIPPKIIIEEYLEGENGGLDDYKFYCCNGEPKFVLVVSDRKSKIQTRTFVDLNWKPIPVRRKGMAVAGTPKKPEKLAEMLKLCKKLAKDYPLVRIDFYEVDGKVYVGELTFTPGLFLGFRPIEMDYKLGEYLDLSKYMNKETKAKKNKKDEKEKITN